MATYAPDINALETKLHSHLRSPDDASFQKLFIHFRQRIYRTALRILKEEESAKDALQETMINVHRAADSFRGDSRLSTWINRITVNVCLEMLRRNKKHANRMEEDVSERVDLENVRARDPYQETYRREIASKVQSGLRRLSEKHRFVVQKHDLEGFTIREIAEMLNVAEGTVKSRLFYGREELRKTLSSRIS